MVSDKGGKIEILAPAGSVEGMKAAFHAGADAVYMGGSRFGARAYADNPDEEDLKRAIDYAHIHQKKLYLTLNTLMKDNELEEEVYEFLNPYYKEGLDAVVVHPSGILGPYDMSGNHLVQLVTDYIHGDLYEVEELFRQGHPVLS